MPESPSPRIFLARHGLTQANVDRVHAGLRDDPLLPQGREQAEGLARAVAGQPVRVVWASPLSRARETAEIVARRLGLPLRLDEGLRELDAGPWEGLTDERIRERFPREFERWQAAPSSFRLEGRETLAEAQRRVVDAIERIRGEGADALIVTHSAAIRLARVHYAGEDLDCFATLEPDHCQLFELLEDAGGDCLREIA